MFRKIFQGIFMAFAVAAAFMMIGLIVTDLVKHKNLLKSSSENCEFKYPGVSYVAGLSPGFKVLSTCKKLRTGQAIMAADSAKYHSGCY